MAGDYSTPERANRRKRPVEAFPVSGLPPPDCTLSAREVPEIWASKRASQPTDRGAR